MQTPDPTTVGAAVGAAVMTVVTKMGIDKVRGGNGAALKEKVESHKRDADGKFDRLFEKVDKMAEDVAFIRGQMSKQP